jgi:hypothetical protein
MENTQSNQQSFPEYPVLESNHPFVQWLHTYLLWANIMGVNPVVFTFPSDGEPSVENNLRWRKNVLWVGNDLLERMSPRLLAIIAVRNYMEQQVWHRYLALVVLAIALALMITLAVTDYIRRLLGVNPLWDLVHLLVLPALLDVPSLLHDLARRQTDEEAFERLGEPQMFLLAMQTALEESYRQGETDKQLQKMLKRLNRLRAKAGEPPLTLQEVKQQAGEPLATPEELQEESPLAVNNGVEEEQAR